MESPDIIRNYEETTIEQYKGYSIKRVIVNETTNYVVVDRFGLQRGGSLLDISTCHRWIDLLIKDKENKQ